MASCSGLQEKQQLDMEDEGMYYIIKQILCSSFPISSPTESILDTRFYYSNFLLYLRYHSGFDQVSRLVAFHFLCWHIFKTFVYITMQ